MRRDQVNWLSGPPARDDRRMLRIVRCPKEGFLDLVILSDHLVGVWTHWLDGRTQPCMAPNDCGCQRMHIPHRWKGYLACSLTTDRKVVLAELTGEACRCISLQDSPLTGKPLRGLVLRLQRDRRSRGGRVLAGIRSEARVASDTLPRAPDVHEELMRIWTSRR